jgi:uncharacterized protein (TIGR02452 family)
VITIAAPDLDWNDDPLDPRIQKILSQRIKRIYDIAEREGTKVLILGAFGCGAFHNPPKLVATLMTNLLKGYSFEIADFAIRGHDDDSKHPNNYEIFKSIVH